MNSSNSPVFIKRLCFTPNTKAIIMKHTLYSIIFLLTLTIGIFSCTKASWYITNTPASAQTEMSATITKSPLHSINSSFQTINVSCISSYPGVGELQLEGFNSDKGGNPFKTISISFTILNYTGPSATPYMIDNINVFGEIDTNGVKESTSVAYGSITIGQLVAPQLYGTFSFTCSDSTTVSGGSFVYQ